MNNLPIIQNNYIGFNNLIDLYTNNKNTYFENIEINIRNFFAANMSAPLGVVLDKLTSNINSINIHVSEKAKDILQRNCFLSNYGYEIKYDKNDTTIPYTRFSRNESKNFADYVYNKLLSHNSMPNLSEGLKRKVLEVICELFSNASLHSKTSYIYACGQYYPNLNQFDFTIADMGIGIRENVSAFMGKDIDSIKAIQWALVDGNTTKKSVPGGYGLGILKNLITYNNGFMQIVSDDGFYEFNNNRETYKNFMGKFPGTVVNLQFRTNDFASYSLTNE
ncbi:MAG: hypothetical protein WCS06_09435 [Dysgonamonadaceae bacterium]